MNETFPKQNSIISRLRQELPKRERRVIEIDGFRPSAVAVLLADRDGECFIPFTRRAAQLRTHSGQISFPGGSCDPRDADFEHTALRETREELGIEASAIEPIGRLDDVPTPSGYVITPVVARLIGRPVYQPDPGEVAEVFEGPLRAIAAPEAYEDMGIHDFRGRQVRLHAYNYGAHRIWGATARILQQLLRLLERTECDK